MKEAVHDRKTVTPDKNSTEPVPLLSILLPTHNRADVLPIALNSIFYQTIQDFEILLVGDGCTDNTAEVVRSYKDERIRWYDLPKTPNFGYANRNIVLKEARGKYIGFMAHDDILFYDHFEKCIEALEADQSKEIACTRPLWITRDGMIIPVEFNFNNPSTLDDFIMRRHNAMPAPCVVHLRKCFEKYGYWDDRLTGGADWDMWARIIEGGGRHNFIFITEPTILHFIAAWRDGKSGCLHKAEDWIDLYESVDDLPGELLVKIPENMTEQSVVWGQLSKDPVKWASDIRRAAVSVFDLRIVHDGRHLIKLLKETLNLREENLQNSSISGHLNKLMDQNRQMNRRLNDIYGSYSWKLGRGITYTVYLFFNWIPGLSGKTKKDKKQAECKKS
jgi:glycosyltransferase involved in cell wall biosynthesis